MTTPKTSPRRGRPIKRQRETVLETAMNAYWQAPHTTVSVNTICALAEVSKPSLYRDFGSEDGLRAAALARYAQDLLEPLATLLTHSTNLSETLDQLVDFASDDPRMASGCLFIKMRTAAELFGPQTQTQLASIEAHLGACYTRLFSEASRRGEWVSPISAKRAADYLQEQVGLAATLRAAGHTSSQVRDVLELALTAIRPGDNKAKFGPTKPAV